MLFMSKSKHKKALLIGLGIVLLVGIAFIFARPSSPTFSSSDPEVLRQELDRVTQYELENGCVDTNDRGQQLFCGESKTKVDAAHAAYQAALKAQFQPNPQAENSIRTFMNEPDLILSNQGLQHPSNFTVGTMEAFPGGGGGKTTTPPEWERNVYLYNQENMDTKCQFYSYEVDARNNAMVQVQLISNLGSYDGSTAVLDQKSACEKSLKTISADEAKQIATDYLQRNIPGFASIAHMFTFKPLANDGVADRYEMIAKDTNYKLPEGLTSEPYPYPRYRVVISNKGYLMTYLNTAWLFPGTYTR